LNIAKTIENLEFWWIKFNSGTYLSNYNINKIQEVMKNFLTANL